MLFKEIQVEIESPSMITRLNVASGLKTFLRGIQAEPTVQELRAKLATKETQEKVLSRLIELSRQRIDRQYENPWDTALTIYLWTISSVDHTLSILAAEIVSQAPQCWWAQKLATQLLSEKQTLTVSSIQPFNITTQAMAVSYLTVQATSSSLISLDNAVLSAPASRPVRIHMPNLSGCVSQSEVQGDSTWRYTSTAANQDLAAAA